MNYDGLHENKSTKEEHLGGNIIEGDPFTFSPLTWNYVTSRFSIKSVLDLGSGLGYSADYFFNQGMQVIAVDGLEKNVIHSIYPTIKIDLTKHAVICSVDLVHCQELVEHVEEKYLDNVLISLSMGKIILMTHATPNQGGYHHLNEQISEYWIRHLSRYNCHLLSEDTKRIRNISKTEGANYLAKTGLIFANRNRI